MDALIDFVWDTGFLVHIAMLGYVLGFLFRDQIILRILVLVGTAFYIAYYYYHPVDPLWGAIYASLLIGGATLIGLVRIIYSRTNIGIPEEQRPIFNALSGLEPGEFRQLMRIAEKRTAERPTRLTREDEMLDFMFFVSNGELTGEKDGVKFPIPSGEFIGDVSFMLNSKASASVLLEEGGEFYQWRKEALRKAMERQQTLAHAFEALIGRGMAQKVAGSRRAG
ncbi:MAG: cyclic nucleotide-binding domain-containing protein [Pseudomonadota bacterium]